MAGVGISWSDCPGPPSAQGRQRSPRVHAFRRHGVASWSLAFAVVLVPVGWLRGLMRLALVDILLVLAPVAAMLWILPQTQAWASLWAQRFTSTVFAQFVQMLALSLGLDLLTKLPTNGAAALLQPLLGIAVLAVGLKIPGLMGGALAGGNVVSTVAGAAAGAAVGMGTRALAGAALRGGGAASPPAAS